LIGGGDKNTLGSRLSNRFEACSSAGLTSRKRPRWYALNEVLMAKAKKMTKNEHGDNSRAYSSVTWNEVKDIYAPILEQYEEVITPIPGDIFETLFSYLKLVSACFSDLRGKEAKRMYFICPIVVAVCNVFKGEVKIKVEEDLTGAEIHAHGHFEIILERGDKKICIVEAKRDDMEQGLAQCLLGCEVISDLEKTDVVFGITTTYQIWNLTRTSDEKIQEDEITLAMEATLPTRESLMQLTGKICSLLT
jgi:hypothetical protein